MGILSRDGGASRALMALGLAIVFPTAVLAADSYVPPLAPQGDKWGAWFELGGYYGTDNASRGEVTLFTPFVQDDTSLLFGEVRGKLFEDDVEEGNFALGYREMLPSGWNLGIWGGADVRSTSVGNTFWQAAGGVEALSENIDARVNGYVPLTDPKASPGLATVFLTGNQILMTGGFEVPLYGVDGEVGVRLFGGDQPVDDAPYGQIGDFWVYGGGFYFDDDMALQEVAGPKARAEWRFDDFIASLPGSRLTLESEFSYDEVRDDKWEVGLRLRIPLGGSGSSGSSYAYLSPQERRMTEGLERDTDIVTTVSEEENVIDNATDVAFDQVAYANSAPSLGAAVGTGANTLLIVDGSGGVIDVSATNGQALQANQTIQGGSSTIQVRGATSGTVAPFTAPGAMPTLFSNDADLSTGVVTVANNTHVAGLGMQGPGPVLVTLESGASRGAGIATAGNYGVFGGGGLDNVVIEQNAISKMAIAGVFFGDDNSNIRVLNNTISETGGFGAGPALTDGFQAPGDGFDAVATPTTVAGVYFGDGNSNITVSDNTISETGGFLASTLTNPENLAVSDPVAIVSNAGIYFGDTNSNVTVSDNTIANTQFVSVGLAFPGAPESAANGILPQSSGVFFNDGNSNVSVTGNTISQPVFTLGAPFLTASSDTAPDTPISDAAVSVGAVGVFVHAGNSNVTVSDNTIVGGGYGVLFVDSNNGVSVSNNTITDISNAGIQFGTGNTGLSLSDNTFSNIGVVGSGPATVDVFEFTGTGNTLLAGSTGNAVSNAPHGVLCRGTPGNFTGGPLEVTDQNGNLFVFETVDLCTP